MYCKGSSDVTSNTDGLESEIKEEPVSPGRENIIAGSLLEPEIVWLLPVKEELSTSHDESGPPTENACKVDDMLKVELFVKEEPLNTIEDGPQDITSRLGPQEFHQSPIQVDSGEKPYVCDICDYKTVQLRQLKRHMMTHASEKPYACDTCHFRTGHLSSLTDHIRTHTGDVKFHVCDICEYKTDRPSNLERHKKTHTRVTPHACDLCDYKTVRLAHLKRHMRTHGGERPLACNICSYTTGSFSHLQAHMVIHSAFSHDQEPALDSTNLSSPKQKDFLALTLPLASQSFLLNKPSLEEAELQHVQDPSISGKCIKGRRQRFCKFCEKRFSYLAHHLKVKHSNEPEVAEYVVAPTLAAKKECLAKIISEGDRVYNELHPTAPSVLRRARGNVERVKCNYCSSFVSIKHVKEHYRNHHPDKVDVGILRMKRRKTKVPPLSTPLEIEQYLNGTVLPSLKNENHRKMITNNKFLMAHANILTRKTVWDRNRRRTIATNLRTICTIIEHMIHLKPEIDLPQCAFGSNYKIFVKAVTESSKDKPSIVDQYALMFKRFVETVSVELLGETGKTPEENSSWLSQYEKRFSFELGKTSR